MPLTLRIENFTSLPDGGPLSYTIIGERTVDIGRDQHLDWSLPDKERFISSKHCEIKSRGGEYILTDVSTNGTFVNGASARVQSPYRIKDGDRLQIGEYLVVASITNDHFSQQVAAPAPIGIDRPSSYDSLWDSGDDVPQPIDPKFLRAPQRAQPVYGDFLDRVADVPRVTSNAQFAPADSSLEWAPFVPKPEQQEAPVRVPEPRRPTARQAGWDEDNALPVGHRQDAANLPARERIYSDAAQDIASEEGGWDAPSLPEPRAAEPPAPDRFQAQSASAPFIAPTPRAAEANRVSRDDPGLSFSAADALIEAFTNAVGLPRTTFDGRSPQEIGTLLGEFVLAATENLQHLLQARTQAKQMARSADHTVIQPQGNNPLKFTPTPQDALRIILGQPTRSYLGASQAIVEGFADLKQHQVQSFSAMQSAVIDILTSLDPETLKGKLEKQGTQPASLFKSQKTQLWDAYLVAWADVSSSERESAVNKFMARFGEFYDKAGNRS